MSIKGLSVVILALIAGLLIGFYLPVDSLVSVLPITVALLLFLVSIVRKRKHPFRVSGLRSESIAMLLFFGLGLFSMANSKPSQTEFEKGKYCFSGNVIDYIPTTYGDKLLVQLKSLAPLNEYSDGEIRNVYARITVRDATDINYGDLISGTADLSPVSTPGNHYNKDYVKYLHNQRIYLSGSSKSVDIKIEKTGGAWLSFFKNLRYNIERSIEMTSLLPETKGFLISVLLGDKSYLSSEDIMEFSDAGIAHIFAVSGFHVSLIGIFILSVLSLFLTDRWRAWKFFIAIPLIWGYVLLVGAGPATCRAGIMLSIGFLAAAFQRKNNPLVSLGWAIILILSFFPNAIFDVGFQLSVVCVGSLILFAERLNFINHRHHPLLYKFVGYVLVAIIATVSTWMLCAFYFHKFSLMFLPLNLIAVPGLPVYLLMALIYLLLTAIGLDLHIFSLLVDGIYSLFRYATGYLTEVSTPIDNLHPGILSVIIWMSGILILAWYIRNRRKRYLAGLSSVFLMLGIFCFIFLPSKTPEGFIIQKNSGSVAIMNYENGREDLVEMPPEGLSKVSLNGKNIVNVNTEELTSETIGYIADADMIILGDGVRELPDQVVNNMKSECRVITHPSMHWRYEKRILSHAEELNIPVHSIRYDGPLHVFNEN